MREPVSLDSSLFIESASSLPSGVALFGGC